MASDNFTNSDLTALTVHQPSWALNIGNFHIFSNSVAPNIATQTECAAHYTGAATSPDQYAEITVAELGVHSPAIQIGVAVRCQGPGVSTYYGYYADSVSRWLFKMVSGGFTTLAHPTVATNVGDVLRLEISGNVLTPKINGVLDTSIGPVTDTSIVSGQPGISGYWTATDVRGDNWNGGDLNPPPPPPPNVAFNEAEISWSANTEPDLAGYRVYWGMSNGGPYPNSVNVGNVTSYLVTGLTVGTWYFVVTAYDTASNESVFSAQVSKVVQAPVVIPLNVFMPVVLMPSVQVIKHASY